MPGGRCGGVKHITAKQYSQRLDRAAPLQRPSRRRALSRPPKPASRIPFIGKRREQRLQTCLLFSRLPAELRIMVFSHVFGDPGDVVHVLWIDRRLAHTRCQTAKSREQGDARRLCFREWRRPSRGGLYDSSYGGQGALVKLDIALLQTCRQAYSEAIDLLYSVPTLDFESANSFMHFERAILPQRLHGIKALQVSWFSGTWPTRDRDKKYEAEYLPSYWDPMCKTITTMAGLRYLTVEIFGVVWSVEQGQDLLLQPLEGLRGLTSCNFHARYCRSHLFSQDDEVVEISSLGKRIMAQATLAH
ncbi:hypothetical protein BU16DRAFT_540156 [Lophium mytilinum]|uniref:DUF7730 domain-containing protein n=1 Tax=Lophium mytilinum TaxID=390894 RepID=A0A6A6QVH7_9PEZI|nr:hypothetical protein BU16DRAFT_540156 [Lophium mytilinum]